MQSSDIAVTNYLFLKVVTSSGYFARRQFFACLHRLAGLNVDLPMLVNGYRRIIVQLDQNSQKYWARSASDRLITFVGYISTSGTPSHTIVHCFTTEFLLRNACLLERPHLQVRIKYTSYRTLKYGSFRIPWRYGAKGFTLCSRLHAFSLRSEPSCEHLRETLSERVEYIDETNLFILYLVTTGLLGTSPSERHFITCAVKVTWIQEMWKWRKQIVTIKYKKTPTWQLERGQP